MGTTNQKVKEIKGVDVKELETNINAWIKQPEHTNVINHIVVDFNKYESIIIYSERPDIIEEIEPK